METIGNEYYEIYKYGVSNKIPIRYVFFNGDEIDDATTLVRGKTESGFSLDKVYNNLILFLKKIPSRAVAFLYYKFTEDNEDRKRGMVEQYYQTFTGQTFGRTIFKFGDFQKEFIIFEEDWDADLKKQDEVFKNQTLRYQEILSNRIAEIKFPEEQFRDTTTSRFYPLLKNELIIKDDGFEIFNRCKATNYVPYIHWRDDRGNDFFKIYSPINGDSAPSHKFLKIPIRPQPNRIYFYLFLETSRISRDSYTLCELNLEDSYAEVTYSKIIAGVKGEEYFIDKFVKSFDLEIIPEARKDVNFSGKLYFDSFSINEDILYFIITSKKIFTDFYVSEDRDVLLPEPKTIFKFRGFRGYRPTFATSRLPTSASVEFYLNDKKTFKQKVYYEIVVTRASGELEYRSFREELSHLLGYYLDNFDEYRNIFETYLTGDYETINTITYDTSASKAFYHKKLSLLKDKAKDMFTGGSRKVQCKDQPVIIDEDDVEAWKALTINGNERDVLYFPPTPGEGDEVYPGEKQFIFVCPDDTNPYPQLKQIKLVPGEITKYPMMPICHERKMDISYYYDNFYRFRAQGYIPEDGAPKENVTVTQKIRRFLEEGEISAALDNYFTALLGYSFRRSGTDVSPNSLIGACLLSIDKERYLSLSQPKRFLECENVRLQILGKEYLLKQELFDESIDEISKRISDLESFFDSFLFYRGLEEILNVNIFVFLSEGDKAYFEIPRNTSTHIRIPRPDRKSVLVYKNFGSENEPLQFPHYELISLIDQKDYNLIYDSFVGVQSSYLWDKGVTRISPYSRLDWTSIIPNAFSQYIDGYGKTRIINIMSKDGNPISIFTLPTQPLNLRLESRIYECSPKDIEGIFSQPPSDINKDGYFYRIFDYERGIFVPIEKVKSKEITTKAPIPFSLEDKFSEFTRYKMIKRSAAILKECIVWCWRNDALQRNAEDWFDIYIYEDVSLSDVFYPNEDKLNISFPVLRNRSTEFAISSIESWWNGIFSKRRINLPTSLYDKFYNFLKDIDRETEGIYVLPEKYLNSEIKNSFISYDNNIILLDMDSYINYVRNIQEQQNNFISSFVKFTEPFPQLVQILESRIYIVQNISDGKLRSALSVCKAWKESGINIGAKTVGTVPESNYQYGVYIQTPDTKIVPFEDHTVGSLDYYQVLRFENNYYALLQLY